MVSQREFNLPCYDGRKSFYGKAKVSELRYEYDGDFNKDSLLELTATLYSYGTPIAHITKKMNGELKFVQKWDGWSATTQRHIDSFRWMYGFPRRNSKESIKRRFINKWFSGNEKGYRKVRKENYSRVLKKWAIFLKEEKTNGNITVKQYRELLNSF